MYREWVSCVGFNEFHGGRVAGWVVTMADDVEKLGKADTVESCDDVSASHCLLVCTPLSRRVRRPV